MLNLETLFSVNEAVAPRQFTHKMKMFRQTLMKMLCQAPTQCWRIHAFSLKTLKNLLLKGSDQKHVQNKPTLFCILLHTLFREILLTQTAPFYSELHANYRSNFLQQRHWKAFLIFWFYVIPIESSAHIK